MSMVFVSPVLIPKTAMFGFGVLIYIVVDPATIPLEQVRFTGSPQFSPNGSMSHKPFDPSISWPENVHYFGEPSPEIDANWEKLIEFRYFSISEEEAKSVWGDGYHEYVDQLQGGYTAG
jgi:hypothetical protein